MKKYGWALIAAAALLITKWVLVTFFVSLGFKYAVVGELVVEIIPDTSALAVAYGIWGLTKLGLQQNRVAKISAWLVIVSYVYLGVSIPLSMVISGIIDPIATYAYFTDQATMILFILFLAIVVRNGQTKNKYLLWMALIVMLLSYLIPHIVLPMGVVTNLDEFTEIMRIGDILNPICYLLLGITLLKESK